MVLLPLKVPKETPEEAQQTKILSSRRNYVDLICYFANYITNVIREVFYDIWRFSSQRDWQNTPQEGENFAKTIGRRAWITASRRQKLLMESGESELWDLKLLTHILLGTDFGPENNLSEELALTLRNLNDLQHGYLQLHDVITDDDSWEAIYRQLKPLVAKFDSRIIIRAPCTKIDKMADESNNNGNFLVNNGKITNSIDSYSSALKLTRNKQQLAKIYANRSSAYLRATNEFMPEESLIKMALEDAKRSVSLNPDWFRGHQRLGNVYVVMKKHRKARKCFDIALVLAKSGESVVEDKKYCELAKLPPDGAVAEKFKNNKAELTKVLTQRFGPHLSWDEVCEEILRLSNVRDPEVSVYQAQCLLEGEGMRMAKDVDYAFQLLWDVAQEASDFAGGYYLMGLMAASGFGIEKNSKLAFSSFLKAASFPLNRSEGQRNVGVNEAEYELGICYEKSIGISGNLGQAVDWFAKAAENGSNDAAMRLGRFYSQGRGVESDLVIADFYFTMAAERNSEKAILKLAHYAINDGPETENKNLNKQIGGVEEDKRDLVVQEDKRQTAIRELVDKHVDFVELRLRRFSEFPRRRRFAMFSFDYSDSVSINIDLAELKSMRESVTARDLVRAVDHFHLAGDLLCKLDGYNFEAAIHQLAQGLRISGAILDWNSAFHKAAMALVWRMKQLTGDEKSQFDADLRVCFVLVLVADVDESLAFFEESLEKYPEDAWFPRLHCNLLGSIFRYERAIEVADRALKYCPDDVELMFWRAQLLWKYENADVEETIAAFRGFLRAAPSDHRMVPESCIKMASCLQRHGATRGEVRKYFRLGCDAEVNRLTPFPPVEEKLKSEIASKMVVVSSGTFVLPIKEATEVRRSYQLTESFRVDLIRAHREAILKNVCHASRMMKAGANDFKPDLESFESLTLREADLDAEYSGFVLKCVVVDEPVITESDMQIVIEDGNGDVATVRVAVVLGVREVRERFGFGCGLGIVNPHIETLAGGKEIYMDDLDLLVARGERDLDRCRFCGDRGANFKCSICKKGYCSEDCQISDWKILNHKLVCFGYKD